MVLMENFRGENFFPTFCVACSLHSIWFFRFSPNKKIFSFFLAKLSRTFLAFFLAPRWFFTTYHSLAKVGWHRTKSNQKLNRTLLTLIFSLAVVRFPDEL